MEDLLGLPLHPLVVHAVVVLVPLVAVGMLLAVVSGTWAERLRLVLAVLAVAAAGAGFVAASSGRTLLARVPGTPEVARHADVADLLPWMLLATCVAVVGWAWAGRTGRPTRLVGLLAVVLAGAATVWTVLAGHAGAVAVWGEL